MSDFNPVFFASLDAKFYANAIANFYCSHCGLPWHMQQSCRRIRVIQASIAERTSLGIPPRRARAHDAGLGIRVVR